MASLMEELTAREEAARARAEELKAQIAVLTGQLAEVEEDLSRLAITRTTIPEVLSKTPATWDKPVVVKNGEDEDAPIRAAMAGPHQTVAAFGPGIEETVLPVAYRDVIEVITDAGRPLQAKEISIALGIGDEPRHVEGMRSKLKRLLERGWLVETEPGQFTRSAP